MKKLFVPLILIPTLLFSQSRKERKALEAQQKVDQQIISNLRNHVQSLAAGKTNNQAGTSSIGNAADYIATQFKSLGLQPRGSNGYLQSFSTDDGKLIDPSTYLKIHDTVLQVNKEYFPLPYSAEKKVSGMPAMALRERGVPWFADLKEWQEDGAKAQPINVEEAIKKEVAKIAGKGATALIVYNSGNDGDGLLYNKKDKSAAMPIPVIYMTREGYRKYLSDNSQMLDIELNVAFKESKITGSNIIGYIDNGAPATIIFGAHYRLPASVTPNATIQNTPATATDDNSSGLAMLIELARMLSASKAKNNNYLFLALGGNDQGVAASNYWLENNAATTPVNYLVNLDLGGNYNDSSSVRVQGYTSSPTWNSVFTTAADKKLVLALDSSRSVAGTAEPFLHKGIPVLSFSVARQDNSAADADGRINYTGVLQIARLINKIVEVTDSKGRIAFAAPQANGLHRTGSPAEVRDLVLLPR